MGRNAKFDGIDVKGAVGSLAPFDLSPISLDIIDNAYVVLPSAKALTDALFIRVGDNLVIRTADGEVFIVRDRLALGLNVYQGPPAVGKVDRPG